jgi:hypothetical protein
VARKKGDKDYTKSDKQLLISLIDDYSLFEATDNEIIEVYYQKKAKKIGTLLPQRNHTKRKE